MKNQKALSFNWANCFETSREIIKIRNKIIGTSFDALDLAEDRGRFRNFNRLNIPFHNLEQKQLMKLLL
jgi:carbamoylphosphate synthase large subunit